MLQLNKDINYFVYPTITDMRKGFNGLATIVHTELDSDPTCGEAYVFFSKNCAQVKILLWEGDGFSLYYKRLEGGTFQVPACKIDGTGIYIDDLTLGHILRGVNIDNGKFRKRFTGKPKAA